MQKIKSLLTFVLILFAMTAQAQTLKFTRLDDITKLRENQQFIIVTERQTSAGVRYSALGVERKKGEHHCGAPVYRYSDDSFVQNSNFDSQTTNGAEIFKCGEAAHVAVLRATDIQQSSSTSIKAVIRMGSCWRSSSAGVTFLQCDPDLSIAFAPADVSGGYILNKTAEHTTVWTLTNDAHADLTGMSNAFSTNLETEGVIFASNNSDFATPRYLNTACVEHPIEGQSETMQSIFTANEDANSCVNEGAYTTHTYIYVMENCVHDLFSHKAVTSTCYVPGNIAYTHCDRCGRYFTDKTATTEITLEETVLPFAHNLELIEASDPTCDREGNVAYYQCTSCHRYFTDETYEHEIADPYEECRIPSLGHNMEYVEEVAPTCTNPGACHYHCSRCSNDYTDAEGMYMAGRGNSGMIPSLGHEYANGSNTCGRCGEEAAVYHQAYNYDKVMANGKCIFVAKIDGKYYTVGRLVSVPNPLNNDRGGRGRGDSGSFLAYEAVEVTPQPDGSIKASVSGLQEFDRELLTSEELSDCYGRNPVPCAMTLRTNDGYLNMGRTGVAISPDRNYYNQALEVFMPGGHMPERDLAACISAFPIYTTAFQFADYCMMRFATIGGQLYFTYQHPSSLYEGYDPYYAGVNGCPPEYPYYVYTLTADTAPDSPSGAPNPYFNKDAFEADGSLDAQDIESLAESINSNLPPAAKVPLDYDGDGEVSIGDLVKVIENFFGADE